MPSVKIRIESFTSIDPYPRYHGKSVDSSLDQFFWSNEPSKIIGVAGQAFIHEQTVELSSGSHYIVYGNSGYVSLPYYWETKILVDGVIKAQGRTGRDGQLKADFTVGVPPEEKPPVEKPVVSPWLLGLAAVAVVGSGTGLYYATRRR